ncbi:MAG TPA: hypothetical protein VER03_12765, partial [Bryobacteraceae bacterium]|nr:hypothetical protein [Bryobacteraceae bacterium]
RLDIGRKLRGRATACMDLSDGLSIDLHRLCLASGVCAELETVPVFPGATQKQALDGGEDYELLFTTSHRTAPKGCIRIGSVRHGEPGAIYLGGKRLRVGGHDHFAKRS